MIKKRRKKKKKSFKIKNNMYCTTKKQEKFNLKKI